MLMEQYARILMGTIEKICTTQKEKILLAAQMAKECIVSDGLIYVFGCGHSHILGEETFYRAGGLACVYPIFNERLMLHESASMSSQLEKENGHGEEVLSGYNFTSRDILICVSTSGINGVPVEVAELAKEKGLQVIGIASDAYLSQKSRSASGHHLQDVCCVCIDNAVPFGDACLQPEGLPVKMTPVSTVSGTYIINSILAEAVELALKYTENIPIYLSGNIPGGTEFNRALIERYKKRIVCL